LFMPKGRLRWAGAIRANQATPELLKLMKQSGCFRLNIGVESGSDRMLKAINKRTTVEMNMKAIQMVKDAGIDLFITLMIGIPGESKEDMMQTIDLMEKLQPATFGFSWFKPLPGSRFYSELVEAGRINKAEFDGADLGNCNHFPEEVYCDVPRDEAKEIYDIGTRIAYKDNVLSVFDDVAQEIPETIGTITTDEDLRYISSDIFVDPGVWLH
ncbi:MAG: radical SAM protein, partial [Proteobacteria bacterium]|nr:radical SAM protein [Pseudomonadota bacterium]